MAKDEGKKEEKKPGPDDKKTDTKKEEEKKDHHKGTKVTKDDPGRRAYKDRNKVDCRFAAN